jgi:hypothetical protein
MNEPGELSGDVGIGDKDVNGGRLMGQVSSEILKETDTVHVWFSRKVLGCVVKVSNASRMRLQNCAPAD